MSHDYPRSVTQLSGVPGAITHRRSVITGEWIELPEPLYVDDADLLDWLKRRWNEDDAFDHTVYAVEGVPRS